MAFFYKHNYVESVISETPNIGSEERIVGVDWIGVLLALKYSSKTAAFYLCLFAMVFVNQQHKNESDPPFLHTTIMHMFLGTHKVKGVI